MLRHLFIQMPSFDLHISELQIIVPIENSCGSGLKCQLSRNEKYTGHMDVHQTSSILSTESDWTDMYISVNTETINI